MERLYDYAKTLDVQVEHTDLTHLHRNGDYCHQLQIIRLQEGLLPRKERHTFAHELGHATYGDEPSIFPHIHKRQEDRADEWAAHFLIAHPDFEEAEARHGGHIEMMATDLYVLPKTVTAYKRTLHRVGDTIYVNARMGAGQWDRRIHA